MGERSSETPHGIKKKENKESERRERERGEEREEKLFMGNKAHRKVREAFFDAHKLFKVK